jgi:hypothetical protein
VSSNEERSAFIDPILDTILEPRRRAVGGSQKQAPNIIEHRTENLKSIGRKAGLFRSCHTTVLHDVEHSVDKEAGPSDEAVAELGCKSE